MGCVGSESRLRVVDQHKPPETLLAVDNGRSTESAIRDL